MPYFITFLKILVHVTYIDVHYNSKPRTFMNTSMIRYMRVTGTFPARVTTYQFYRLRDIKGAEHETFYQSVNKSY